MNKPIKKEDFLRHKAQIDSPGTNMHRSHVIHGHDIGFNDEITDYYTSINCGVLLDNSFDKGISLCTPLENRDGYMVGQWEMICPADLKLGQIMDRMPFGIIDKTITGLGATTLELVSQIRSSIIVVPTKALAYNKHILINQTYDGLTMYVGSRYGDIHKDTTKTEVRKYLSNRGDAIRKFLTVADSLPKLLGFLEELGEPIYEDYFLMIDEIDTMQMDSSYRPRLEAVTDYYFKFDFMNRAMVSATIQPFSNANLEKEGRVLLRWEKQPQRNIGLVNTNYVDDAAFNVIYNLIDETDDKILVAYNSLDGIFNIVKLLGLQSNDYGILCSNRSSDKVENFEENATDAITSDGKLKKRITFITCAFFAGIDIMESCHLISISSYNQPFTYLSIAKLAQIAGRCRYGNLSETIIYDVTERNFHNEVINAIDYRSSLLNRAEKYAQFLNTMLSLANDDEKLSPMADFVKSYVSFAAKDKSSATDYPLSIVREHSITKQFVPSYFNIDALTDRWETIHNLYSQELSLYEALINDGHSVTIEPPIYIPKHEHDNEFIKAIKEIGKEQVANQFEALRTALLDWGNNNGNDFAFEEIARSVSKRLQENIIMPFKLLHTYIPAEHLLECLGECYMHDRKIRNFINAAIFYSLPSEHPFKATLMMTYGVDIMGQGKQRFNMEERHNRLKEVFTSVLNYKLEYDKAVLSDLLNSCFKWARNKDGDRVNGLNPLDFPPLKKAMNVNAQLLNLLVFPK